MSHLYTAQQKVKHQLAAGNEHDVHSPFVFELIEDVIKPSYYYLFDEIEALRGILQLSDQMIEVTDLGAGSRTGMGKQRKISDIAKASLKSKAEAQFLFRLVKHMKVEHAIELGTSLGLTSAYIGGGMSPARLVTIEGCPQTAKVAQLNWNKIGVDNVDIHVGAFEDLLPGILESLTKVDFVFFDGNHQYEPTINYFNACLNKVHSDTVFVFDDIYWSKEMTRAWEEIKEHPQVHLTIDLFNLGLVFFRDKQPKQHFKLKTSLLK